MKYYIYRCRCEYGLFNQHAFQEGIINIRNVEKYNAITNGKLEKYDKNARN